ncbi:MAG: Abi family protein [Mycoplasmoidaceae bacterium]|nr:Abi family protein [Mycoplasmoidaceae bacterium]
MDKKSNQSKTFKDFNEQITLLQSRGLIFHNKVAKEKFKHYLRLFNYQNFVNGYNDFFMINNDRSTNTYKSTTNSEHIINLFNFDRNISSILLPTILSIERAFSTTICYYILSDHKNLNQKINEGKILDLDKKTFLKIFPNLLKNEIKNFKENILGYCSNKVISKKYSSNKEIPL